MYGVNNNYRRAILDDNRNFSAAISMTLSDGTKLEFDNSSIMSDGITFTASSSDESAFSIGNTVCEECEVKLNNIDDSLSGYSFKRRKRRFFTAINDTKLQYRRTTRRRSEILLRETRRLNRRTSGTFELKGCVSLNPYIRNASSSARICRR